MGHSLWFTGTSGITGLLGFAAALVLFMRSRSAATGLFLAGSTVQMLIPFSSWFFGSYTMGYLGLITLSNLCAGIGLLWYALQLPKAGVPAPVAAAAPAESDGNRFFK
jgi:hypothetical protein